MKDNKVSIQFPGFTTFLGIAFIILKLCKVIDWAWVWVLAPIWGSWAIFFIIVFVLYLILK